MGPLSGLRKGSGLVQNTSWKPVAGLVLVLWGASQSEKPGEVVEPPDAVPMAETVIEGVSFADAPGTLYAPIRELGEALDLPVRWEEQGGTWLGGNEVSPQHLRGLPSGSQLLALRALVQWSATVSWDPESGAAQVTREQREVRVPWGEKRVEISLDAQQLRAYQGERLVLDTRISSGRPGMETPTGSFAAGPLKTEMLISRKYGNAKMPWSVQVREDVVIHGFRSVPPRAASHGCVRLPLTGANPARWFYHWVTVGTPIQIANDWPT